MSFAKRINELGYAVRGKLLRTARYGLGAFAVDRLAQSTFGVSAPRNAAWHPDCGESPARVTLVA
jgi:hypothetical protein